MRKKIFAALVAALAVGALGAPVVHASVVAENDDCNGPPAYFGFFCLSYDAKAGEPNNLTIGPGGGGSVYVTDSGALISPDLSHGLSNNGLAPCIAILHWASCPNVRLNDIPMGGLFENMRLIETRIALGDGNDRFSMGISTPVGHIDAGAGNDVLNLRAYFVVYVDCGPGDDTVNVTDWTYFNTNWSSTDCEHVIHAP
jgi:hypothetical protein